MSYRIWQLTRLDRRFHALAGGIPVAGVATLLLALSCGASAVIADGKAQAAPPCVSSGPEFDTSTDVHALDEYRDAVAQALRERVDRKRTSPRGGTDGADADAEGTQESVVGRLRESGCASAKIARWRSLTGRR